MKVRQIELYLFNAKLKIRINSYQNIKVVYSFEKAYKEM